VAALLSFNLLSRMSKCATGQKRAGDDTRVIKRGIEGRNGTGVTKTYNTTEQCYFARGIMQIAEKAQNIVLKTYNAMHARSGIFGGDGAKMLGRMLEMKHELLQTFILPIKVTNFYKQDVYVSTLRFV